jgi:hypothetical protein
VGVGQRSLAACDARGERCARAYEVNQLTSTRVMQNDYAVLGDVKQIGAPQRSRATGRSALRAPGLFHGCAFTLSRYREGGADKSPKRGDIVLLIEAGGGQVRLCE